MKVNRRIRTGMGLLALCWACTAALAGKEFREEWHQTHPLTDPGQVSVENVNGNIKVTAWDRLEVQVDVIKTANSQKRLDETETKIDTSTKVIRIRTKCLSKSSLWNFFRGNNPANVEYALKVPRLAVLNSLATVNGSIEVQGVSGLVRASTVNGSVKTHQRTGESHLSSVNGRIEAAFDQLAQDKSVSLSTVNGSVSITLPADAGAELSASTVNGGLRSEFDLPVKKNFPIAHRLNGKLGNGGARIKLSTVNGGISIHRGSPSAASQVEKILELP